MIISNENSDISKIIQNQNPVDALSGRLILPKSQILVANDMDDWLFDFVPKYLIWRNNKYGTNFKFEDITNYNLWEIFKTKKEDEMDDVHEFHKTKYSIQTRPNDDALLVLNYLKDDKNIVITSRDNDLKNITRDQIIRYLGHIFTKGSVYLTNNFSKNGESIPKAQKAISVRKSLHLSGILAIDDAPKHIIDYTANGIICLVPDRPWNRDSNLFKLPENAYRFENSKQAKEIIYDLRYGRT